MKRQSNLQSWAGVAATLVSLLVPIQAAQAVPESGVNLEVRVADSSGTPIIGARVLLESVSGGGRHSFFTEDHGIATFFGLHRGAYQITVTAPGYEPRFMEDVLSSSESLTIGLAAKSEVTPLTVATVANLVDLAPWKAEAAYRKGLRNLEKKKFEQARRAFLSAIEIHPVYSAAHAGLGISLLNLRRKDEALAALAQALKHNPGCYDALVSTGLILNDRKEYGKAEAYLTTALEINSRFWQVHYELGRALYGMGRLVEAEKSLRAAREADPKYANLHLLLANTLVLRGNYEEAIAEFEEFLDLSPKSDVAGEVAEKVRLLRANGH